MADIGHYHIRAERKQSSSSDVYCCCALLCSGSGNGVPVRKEDVGQDQHGEGNEKTVLLKQEYETRIAEIDEQVADLDRQINAIYAEWNVK